MATNEDREREAERYRRAAEQTLDQLEWCANYLYRAHKPKLAKVIAKNRATIQQRMRGGG